MISNILQILGLQPRISKVFSITTIFFFLTVALGQNNFGNKIPFFKIKSKQIKINYLYYFEPRNHLNVLRWDVTKLTLEILGECLSGLHNVARIFLNLQCIQFHFSRDILDTYIYVIKKSYTDKTLYKWVVRIYLFINSKEF